MGKILSQRVAQTAGAVEYTDCNECSGYGIKPSYGVLDIWGMWSTLSLSLLPDPLCPGLIAPDRVLSIVQIEQTVGK